MKIPRANIALLFYGLKLQNFGLRQDERNNYNKVIHSASYLLEGAYSGSIKFTKVKGLTSQKYTTDNFVKHSKPVWNLSLEWNNKMQAIDD